MTVGLRFINDMNRKILSLAIPSIIANITTPLLGLVDTAIVGHMGSEVFIAAIAVGGSVFNLLYWCFAFLRMGSSGMTAQAYGANDAVGQGLVVYRSLLLALGAGVVMIVLSRPIALAVLRFMEVEGPTFDLALTYISIAVWGAPAVLGLYSLSGWFLGMQNSRLPMWVSIIVNVTNIGVSLLLVYGLGWGIAGVASGTMAAQWCGFLIGCLLLRHHYRPSFPGWSEIARWSGLRRFFSINMDIFLRTFCLVAVTLWFTRAGASQGEMVLAVNALLMQFFMLFSYMMDGFAFAGEALAGRFTGASDWGSLRRCVKSLMLWGAVLAALFSTFYFIGGEWVLGILSSQRDVVSASDEYLPWAVTVPLAGFAAFTWDGVFIGATRTREMLLSMIVAVAAFFAVYFTLFTRWGNHALWLAFVVYLFSRGALQTFFARHIINE